MTTYNEALQALKDRLQAQTQANRYQLVRRKSLDEMIKGIIQRREEQKNWVR